MPHTKLKVCSVLLILYGVVDVFRALSMLVLTFFGEVLGVSQILGSFVSAASGILAIVFLLLGLLYAGMAVVDLMAGINGFRFCNGKCDIKLCRVPAIIVITLQAINVVLEIVDGSVPVRSVVHIVIAVLCIVFAGQVEQYNLTRPPVEDTLVFNLKDGY